MKAEITIKITDTAREPGIPPRTFSWADTLQLDLPLSTSEFAEAVETLIMNNAMPITQVLCDRVTQAVNAYTAKVRKSGLSQLELPFSDAAPD